MMTKSLPISASEAVGKSQAISLKVHPKERRSTKGIPLLCAGCGCCCCCCCCLHSIGGLAFALSVPPDVIQDSPNAPRSPLPSIDIRARYWKVMGIVSLITVGVGLLVFGLSLLIFTLPAFQLLASLIVLISIQKLPLEERPRARWQLGRLTLRGFLGSLAGTLMIVTLFWIFFR